MDDLRSAIIYEIRNLKTKESYVGATLNGFFQRLNQHWRELINATHYNKKLQESWNNCEITDFAFRVLEYGINPDDQHERETFWIRKRGALNIEKKSGKRIRTEKYWRIAQDIHKGKMVYRQIAVKHGVSLGRVARVADRFKMSRKYQREF